MTFSSRSSEDTKLQEWAEKVRKERGGGKETTRLKYPMHAELRKEKIEESQREREREKERERERENSHSDEICWYVCVCTYSV